jgi:hypothetical protein
MADPVCRFNPVYGQGMSVAAREAAIFHQLLGARSALPDPLVGLSIAFFQEAVPLIDAPWTIAANLGFVYPETRENACLIQRARCLALNRIAARDPTVHKLTLEVQHLLKLRSALFTPELVDRVQAEMAVLMIAAFAILAKSQVAIHVCGRRNNSWMAKVTATVALIGVPRSALARQAVS